MGAFCQLGRLGADLRGSRLRQTRPPPKTGRLEKHYRGVDRAQVRGVAVRSPDAASCDRRSWRVATAYPARRRRSGARECLLGREGAYPGSKKCVRMGRHHASRSSADGAEQADLQPHLPGLLTLSRLFRMVRRWPITLKAKSILCSAGGGPYRPRNECSSQGGQEGVYTACGISFAANRWRRRRYRRRHRRDASDIRPEAAPANHSSAAVQAPAVGSAAYTAEAEAVLASPPVAAAACLKASRV